MNQIPKMAVVLPSGGVVSSLKMMHVWRGRRLNTDKIRQNVRKSGVYHLGGKLSEEDVEAVVEMLVQSPEVQLARERAEEANRRKREWEENGVRIMEKQREREEMRQRLLQSIVTEILQGDGARLWRADRREKVERYLVFAVEHSLAEARRATLEAVTRLALKNGFSLRHTSRSSGFADSRYLSWIGETGERKEVRISDHEVPETSERFERNMRFGGPPWAQVIIDEDNMMWGAEQWLGELYGLVGTAKPEVEPRTTI